MAANRIPTWVWVVIGVVVVCALCLVAVAGFGIYFVARQVNTVEASPATADQTFEQERVRFKDQKPVIELDGDDNIRATHFNDPGPSASRHKLESLRVMAWDSDDERLVRIDIPFWLLRLKEDPLDILADSGIHGKRVRITVADIERMGPRLLIDHRGRRGDRVLVWTQ
jgi:hypothetical protein